MGPEDLGPCGEGPPPHALSRGNGYPSSESTPTQNKFILSIGIMGWPRPQRKPSIAVPDGRERDPKLWPEPVYVSGDRDQEQFTNA